MFSKNFLPMIIMGYEICYLESGLDIYDKLFAVNVPYNNFCLTLFVRNFAKKWQDIDLIINLYLARSLYMVINFVMWLCNFKIGLCFHKIFYIWSLWVTRFVTLRVVLMFMAGFLYLTHPNNNFCLTFLREILWKHDKI